MNKKILFMPLVILATIIGCTLDPSITERDYPIINSLGIKEINDTGATVDFEIQKESRQSVDAYGVEYIGLISEENFAIKIEKSGQPKQMESVRIEYDLAKGYEYKAIPFVRKGKQYIYGESMSFKSEGSRSPILESVSIRKLLWNHEIELIGDYFSANINQIQVLIPGLEKLFEISVVSTTHQKIRFRVRRLENTQLPMDKFGKKFDLVLRINGSLHTFPEIFEIDVAKIISINQSIVKVGDEIIFQISPAPNSVPSAYFVSSEGNHFSPNPNIRQIDETTFGLTVADIKSGKYKLAIGNDPDFDVFKDEITVTSSWQFAWDLSSITTEIESGFFVGDNKIFVYNQPKGYLKILDPFTSQLTDCCQFPENEKIRSSYGLGLVYSEKDNSIYFGLGNYFSPFSQDQNIQYRDFHRYDLAANKWVRLPDISDGPTLVNKMFELNGRIYSVFFYRDNFYYFDATSNYWVNTGIAVPEIFKSATAYSIGSNRVYFLGKNVNQSKASLYSFQIGFEPALISTLNFGFTIGDPSMVISGSDLYISHGSKDIFRTNINDLSTVRIQSIHEYYQFRGQFYKLNEEVFFGLPNRPIEPQNLQLYKLID